jgi:hypothetical protein
VVFRPVSPGWAVPKKVSTALTALRRKETTTDALDKFRGM